MPKAFRAPRKPRRRSPRPRRRDPAARLLQRRRRRRRRAGRQRRPDCASPEDADEETGGPGDGHRQPGRSAGVGGNRPRRRQGRRHDRRRRCPPQSELGAQGGGSNASGGVSAPSATAGVQLPPKTASGGSEYNSGGSPTGANMTTTIAPFGPTPIGVPNFVIESFEIPPFLLPIYQACGTEYGIPWQVLAAINKIETDFGTNIGPLHRRRDRLDAVPALELGSVRARRQWRRRKDPTTRSTRSAPPPTSSRSAAATTTSTRRLRLQPRRLVRAGGARRRPRLRQASARSLGSLTGLTEGAHFPVAADATYADDLSVREALAHDAPAGGTPTATRRK